MTPPRSYLFVTFGGGGNVPAVLGMVRRLAVRGHEVRVLTEPASGPPWKGAARSSWRSPGTSPVSGAPRTRATSTPFAEGPTADNEWVRTGPHMMLVVPDPALHQGIPTDPSRGGPYVIWCGTPFVHVMIPVEGNTVHMLHPPTSTR